MIRGRPPSRRPASPGDSTSWKYGSRSASRARASRHRARGRGSWRRRRGACPCRLAVRGEPSRSGRSPTSATCGASSRSPPSLYRNEPQLDRAAQAWTAKRLDRTGQSVLQARRGAVLPGLARRPAGGRISAHIDRRFNEFQDNGWGLFGFFECEDYARAAARAARRRRAWLREHGRDRMVGPMDFTTNDECGLLIEGHERPPIILEPWHHPYYQRCSSRRASRRRWTCMWSLHISGRDEVRRRSGELAEKVEASTGSSAAPCASRTCTPRWTRSSRSTTPPGSTTGLRCR